MSLPKSKTGTKRLKPDDNGHKQDEKNEIIDHQETEPTSPFTENVRKKRTSNQRTTLAQDDSILHDPMSSQHLIMRVFLCTNHDTKNGLRPVSIVVALDEAEAKNMLNARLIEDGQKGDADHPFILTQIDQSITSIRRLDVYDG